MPGSLHQTGQDTKQHGFFYHLLDSLALVALKDI